MTDAGDRGDLASLANKLRRGTIETLCRAQAGHPGGSLSAAEIMAALFFKVMRVDPSNPGWEDRDRFMLSKGHAAAIYYVTLAERGFFPADALATYDEIDSMPAGRIPTCTRPASTCPPARWARGSRRASAWRSAPG